MRTEVHRAYGFTVPADHEAAVGSVEAVIYSSGPYGISRPVDSHPVGDWHGAASGGTVCVYARRTHQSAFDSAISAWSSYVPQVEADALRELWERIRAVYPEVEAPSWLAWWSRI